MNTQLSRTHTQSALTYTYTVFLFEAEYHRGLVYNSPGMSVNIVLQRKFNATTVYLKALLMAMNSDELRKQFHHASLLQRLWLTST